MPPKAEFHEYRSPTAVRGVEISHLSIEVGHLYMGDLVGGADRAREQFRRIAPWVHAAEQNAVSGRNSPRVSTCFLIDDYFYRDTDPRTILGTLLPLAEDAGLRIDYLAREAGCAETRDGLRPAELVAARLLPEPAPGSTGSRPPVQDTGWLSNGKPSAGLDLQEAMRRRSWRPPQEFAARNHSIFLDIELWKDCDGTIDSRGHAQRTWSCPFLASVWQLLRLGLLRNLGRPVVAPVPWDHGPEWPRNWADMDTLIQLNPDAKPFMAYRSVSVMPNTFLPVEHAVRVILDHVVVENAVLESLASRARGEDVELPAAVADRVTHVFVEGQADGR